MCGILCSYGKLPKNDISKNRLAHRGPDGFRSHISGNCYMAFNRLSINDMSSDGMQPFVDGSSMLICNGEIYNHLDLTVDENKNDCACLLPLIKKHGILAVSDLIRGVFALCYYDGKTLIVSRDPIGVRPLFYTRYPGNTIIFASEMKVLPATNPIHIFPPGHVYDSSLDRFVCYWPGYWPRREIYVSWPCETIKHTLVESVRRRITNTDRKLCFLLSGGLDSSLMVAIARKLMGPGAHIKTFSIGTEDSPDCKAAWEVSKYLKTDHTEVRFNIKDGLDMIHDVIISLESYDTTTVRASVPMWLLSKYISEKTDYRVVISGEGSDEIFGGYLYFHYAPSLEDFVAETTRRLNLLHQFDVLRADRCTAAHGLEVRVPFLDRDFVDCAMRDIDQKLKMVTFPDQPIEKWILRKSFEEGDYLPASILWRQKDAFSDAVGYSWIGELKKYCDIVIDQGMMEEEVEMARNHNAPLTNEEALYRALYRDVFSDPHTISEIWRPMWTNQLDPSATMLDKHLKKVSVHNK
jgi:asparagine synthase (glutamine-hydrolysing)